MIYEPLLNVGECARLMGSAGRHLTQDFRPTSSVPGRNGFQFRFHTHETSVIRHYLADQAGVPLENIEPVEVVRYNEGCEYGLHYDGQHRLHTALVYLNTNYVGGRTVFPNIGTGEVIPKTGSVLSWENARDGINLRQYAHRIDRVLKGEKWIAVCWAQENNA